MRGQIWSFPITCIWVGVGFDAFCLHETGGHFYSIKKNKSETGMKDEGRELESREKHERLLASGLLVLAGPAFFDVSAAGWDQECVPERELLPNSIKTVG